MVQNISLRRRREPSSPRRHTRKRGHAGQKRRVALDKVEKVLRGDAEQSCIRLIGVLPTVVSSGAIWTEIETGFHIELEAPVRINVLPD
jgi:hypothetical protein